MSPNRPSPLVNSTLSHANRVHAMLEAQGRVDAASRLAAEAGNWNQADTTVVVVGDIKRGKSSLINALVDRVGLMPVDADVATAVHLAVRHGSPETTFVSTLDGERFEVERERIGEYASMKGDPDTVAGVSAVEVVVDHPLLARGLQIIDTPGVGGMDRGHRDITMAALQRADLLVFVISLQEPVARTELEFLAAASERIGNVVLVGSRGDLSSAEANEAMVADLRARIHTLADQIRNSSGSGGDAEVDREARTAQARRLDRIADRPVVVTSAYLADQARVRFERGRMDTAAALRAQSGIDDLLAHLERSVGAREMLRLANLLQLASALQAAVEDEQSTVMRALDGDSTVEQELKERGEQMERAASQQARWRTTLATSITRLQTKTGRDVNRELGLVRDHYRNVLEQTTDVDQLPAIGAQLQQSLGATWANLSAMVAASFNEVIGELLAELEIDAEPDLFGELDAPASVQAAGATRVSAQAEVDVLQDLLPLATQTFMFGNIANVLVGVLGVATGGLGVMAYGVGMALSAPVVAMRRKQRTRQKAAAELQREVSEALFGQEGVAREFSTEMNLRILDAREQLEAMIDERLTARRKELDARRRELQELLRSEMTSKANSRQQADRLVEELRGLRSETDRLTAAVDSELTALFSEVDGRTSSNEPQQQGAPT